MTRDIFRIITITAKGVDADIKPITRQYEISDTDDQKIFEASLVGVKDRLDCRCKININDVLLLYAGAAYEILACEKKRDYLKIIEGVASTTDKHDNSKKSTNHLNKKITNAILSLLSAQDVMIGVAEMTKHVTIRVTNHNRDKNYCVVYIQNPIKSGVSAGQGQKYLYNNGDKHV